MDKQETLKSPLDNLYGDFDDFDLGQTVERLKKETKMLNDCIKEQNKDIEKLANTIVELKTANQTLSGNITSLYNTAKAEIERKEKIIADLRREKDDITFRRRDRYFNNKGGIPQNKNSGFNPEVDNSNYVQPQNSNLPQVKKEVLDNKPIPNYNRNMYEGSNMDNIFQERYKQERNTYNNEKYIELPVPCFKDESDGKPCNLMDTNIKFEDRPRSRRLEGEGRPCNPMDTNINFEDRPRSRRLESEDRQYNPIVDGSGIRRFKGEGRPCNPMDTNIKFEDRSRSRSWEDQDTKNFERYNFHNKTDRYHWDGSNRSKSNDRRRDKINDGRGDNSTNIYKKEYGRYGESTKRDHSDDNFSRRRYDSRNDDLYGTYERSKSRKRNRHSPGRSPEYNLKVSKSYKSAKGKKMLKVVDKIEKEVTNMMKSPIPPLEHWLKLPMKKKKDKEYRNNYNEEEEEKINEKKESKKYDEEEEQKIYKMKKENKRKDSKTEPEEIENKAESIDNNYFGSDYNNVLDNIMENIKYKNVISSKPRETFTGLESTVSEDELTLMESRFKILNSLIQDNNELKMATTCTNAPEENMQKLFDPNEATEEKLKNKNSESKTTNDSKNEDGLTINDSLDTDSNHTENGTKEMLTFIETARIKKAGRLNVDDVFGLDSNDNVNKSNEDISTKSTEKDRKNEDFRVDESSKKTNHKNKQKEEISSNKTVDGQNKIKNQTSSNQKSTKKRTEKEGLVLRNIFGDESTDNFGEDEYVEESKKLVQNVEDAKRTESKFINSNDKKKGGKNKKRNSLSENSYEEGKKAKRKKVQENRNSNTVLAKKLSGDKNKLTAELIKTEATLNKKKKSINLTDGPDANLNLIPVENARNEIEMLKPPQKSEEFSSKEREDIGNKSKDFKLHIEDKTSTEMSTDVSNKNNAELNLIKPAASNVETVECENGKQSENKIFIVSDVMIVPSAASNKDSNKNKSEVESLPHFKDMSTLKLSESNDGNKNTSNSISKKEIFLERFALEETRNQPSSDLKHQKENTLIQSMYCKEYKNTDNEIVELKDNQQCFKSKNSEDNNPPKERKVNLDVVLEDDHAPLNSENVLKNQIKSTPSPICKKSLVSLKDKITHQPTRRSKRINSKERTKSSNLNVSTEEMGGEEIKRNTSKDNSSSKVKNNISQFKDNETEINSENQNAIIKQLVNEKIDYLNVKKTVRHMIDISNDKTDICASSLLHTKTSPVNTLSEKQFLSPTLIQTKTVENVCAVQKSSPLSNLNNAPSSSPTATENINGEVVKSRRRITPTRVKDDPVCSFKNILAKNSNTVKLFSKTVAVETNYEEDNDMPILHLEEITLSNIEDGTQKTFDKSITKLLDCMNMSNLDCDMSKLNIPPKESLTSENAIKTVESPTVTNTSAVVEKVVEPITPKKHNLPNLVTSTPKANIQTCQATTTVIEKDDTTDKTNVGSSSANNINSESNCKVTDNSQINKEVPSKPVNNPARFRRRCRIIAVVKDV